MLAFIGVCLYSFLQLSTTLKKELRVSCRVPVRQKPPGNTNGRKPVKRTRKGPSPANSVRPQKEGT